MDIFWKIDKKALIIIYQVMDEGALEKISNNYGQGSMEAITKYIQNELIRYEKFVFKLLEENLKVWIWNNQNRSSIIVLELWIY